MLCHNCLDGGNFLGMVCTKCGTSARNNALLISPYNNRRPVMPKDVNQMLNEIRSIINQYGELPERDVYIALLTESEQWKNKLNEEDDEDDEDWYDDEDDDDWEDEDDDDY